MSKTDITRSAQSWKTSSKHGAGEWVAERLTSLVLIPLTLWAAYAAYQIAGTGFAGALAFVKSPVNAGLIAISIIVAAWHMYMGVKVIVDDYIGKPGTRGLLNFLVFLMSAAVVIASLGALYFVYKGA